MGIEDLGTNCSFSFSLSEVVVARDNGNSSEACSLGQTQSLTRKGPQSSHWVFIPRFMDTWVCGLQAMWLCIFFVNALEIKQKMNGNVILCMEPNHSVYAGLNVFPQSGQVVNKT